MAQQHEKSGGTRPSGSEQSASAAEEEAVRLAMERTQEKRPSGAPADPMAGIDKTAAAQPAARAAVLPPGGETGDGENARAAGARLGRPVVIGLAVIVVLLILIMLF